MHLTIGFSALLATPSHAQEPTPDEILAARETNAGLERFYESDTEWHYALTVDTPQYDERGLIVWRYDGQQVFSDTPPLAAGPVTFVEPDYVLTGMEFDPEGYFAAIAVDAYGRRWVVDTVDLTAAAALVAGDPGQVSLADTGGGETGSDTGTSAGADGIPGIELNPDAGTQHAIDLTSWTISDCTHTKYYAHDGTGPLVEDAGSGALDGLERNLVRVRAGTNTCSGALIDEDAVLTSAHCVTDATGAALPVGSITVCTMENLDENSIDGLVAGCHGAALVAVPGTWTGTNPYDLTADYAIVFLGIPTPTFPGRADEPELGPSHVYMEVTALTDAVISPLADHIEGYPFKNPYTCAWNRTTDTCETVDHTQPGWGLWEAEGAVAGTPVGFVKYHTSWADGMSGAPHYACFPDCVVSPAQITGVQAGVVNMCGGAVGPCATGAAVGPKARDFRLWADALLAMPDSVECPALAEVPFVQPAPVLEIDPAEFSPTCDGGMGSASSTCEDIIVFRPSGATPDDCDPWQRGEKLVVYLPGTESYPEANIFPLEMAAYAGYRTIGLSYANHEDVGPWCKARANHYNVPEVLECVDNIGNYADECLYYTRKERITGIDDTRTTYDSTKDTEPEYQLFDPFPVEDSILFRLFYTLVRLHQEDEADGDSDGDGVDDDCNWQSVFDTNDGAIQISGSGGDLTITGFGLDESSMGAIHWDQIILAGWSQGAGHATLIGLEEEVAGLFLLDGASDMCLEDAALVDSGRPSTYYAALVDGVLEPSSAAPRFGAWHTRSDKPEGSKVDDARPVSWDNTYPDLEHDTPLRGLRMQMCDDQPWDLTATEAGLAGNPPQLKISASPAIPGETTGYRSMTLETDQDWPLTGGCGPHESVALSSHLGSCMPTEAHGSPPVEATSADQAHLFEAYVEAFCELGKGP